MKKAISAILCGFYLAVSVGTGSALVLCLGDDGHIAIEYSNGGSCADSSHEISEAENCELSSSSPHCHCGPCVDIPLNFELLESRPSSLESLTPNTENFVVCTIEVSAGAFLEEATVTTFPIPPPLDFSPTLLALGTVVLLI